MIPVESTHLQEKLLLLHNQIRQETATGELYPFEAAASMPEVRWCPELAYLASLNMKTCEFKHDTCRNTHTYRKSGQNIGYVYSTVKFHSADYAIDEIVSGWINEHEETLMDDVIEYNGGGDREIGHFTLMIQDRMTCLGCAMVRYTKDKQNRTSLACNYSYNNIYGSHIYELGDTGSMCEGEMSEQFPGLCAS